MRLALIGKSIAHSGSPHLYKNLLGHETLYDLIDVSLEELPPLEKLATMYDGVNITSPYKEHYIDQVLIDDPSVKSLGAVNTIDLRSNKFNATNTDLLAVRSILKDFHVRFPKLQIILLGSGVMARVVCLVSQELGIPTVQLNRKSNPLIKTMDLRLVENSRVQNLIINACSRDFIFEGIIGSDCLFWDFNYRFLPHQNTLPFLVKEYHDGQEMLSLQAIAAIKFWQASK